MPDNTGRKEKAEIQASVTRRRVLGTLGTTAGAIASTGFIDTVSAGSLSAHDFRNAEQVKTVLAEVGNPKIIGQKREVRDIDGLKILKVILETEFGTVNHLKVLSSNNLKFDRGDTSTTFEIENLTQETRMELPRQFNSIPTGVFLSILQRGEETTVVTTLTEKEERQLAELVGTEDFIAQHINNYYHVTTAENERYKVYNGGERPNIRNPSVETVLTTQINQDACYDCVVNSPLAECGTCVQHCVPGDAFAPLQCPYCIVDKCADSDIIACAKCIASAAEHIPNPF